MNSTPDARTDSADRDPVVVLAADDGFAMPLAVTIRSAIDKLATDRKLRIFVLDGGLRDETKERLLRSWPKHRYQVTWVEVDPTVLALAPVSGHASRVNYFRILAPLVLPAEVRRAIYLDADLVVNRDIAELWDADLGGYLCLAAQDCAAPYIDSREALANYNHCSPHLGAATPVANYRELGLDPRAAYLNSGVMVIDVARWRDEGLPQQLLACLEQNREHVRWWDQYALNVVLAGRWGQLDLRWNQGSHIYCYPTWSQSPFDRATYEQLRDDPYIIHYTTRYKPWLPSCLHPQRKEFFRWVDRTDWAGWRPWQANRLRTLFEFAKAQERRLRHRRRNLQSRLAEWWHDHAPAKS